ncbi:DUF1810 domain-containing protein [Cognatiluteimonas weifangensis]|uniref:DUF1810 domain-containing protein n=1 Tax=Cognatiluteimonas weifangensis TaxID=2303539 RepID=UPI0018F27169|nr:DUF1810 domain-containing protein [Luteimonas weifangensis]
MAALDDDAPPARADADDPHDLRRFLQAQEDTWADALAELRAGRKRTHWMWFVFPQLAGLGSSAMAQRYAIGSRAEAAAYLAHPVLGPRLLACCEAVLALRGVSARELLGTPDDRKLQSCATLFAAVAPAGSVFERVLARYFDGRRDPATLRRLDG